jgi:hypothetical protein
MAKGVMDAFQGLLYTNDEQVVHLDLLKVHHSPGSPGYILIRQRLSFDHLVLELDEDERGFGDVADPARAGGDMQGGPALGEQREAAFTEAAQRPDQGVAGPAVWLLPSR